MQLSRFLWIAALSSLTSTQATDEFPSAAKGRQIPLQSATRSKRLAIIGAGAAGSSAAYHARKYALEAGIPLNITIFETNSYIGGRSTTVNAYNEPSYPVELGASIFVKVNKILSDAADEFNLSSLEAEFAARPHNEEGKQKSGPLLGIWDGETFVYQQDSGGWWDMAKLFWKYGLSPLKAQNLMKGTVAKFLKMYDAPTFPFADLTATVHELGLADVVDTNGRDFLRENGVGDYFANDIIQAATRVNYAQNLPFIHGLETMVCLATDGAMSIEGGNWQIFERMVYAATDDIRFNTTVSGLQKEKNGVWKLTVNQHVKVGSVDHIPSTDEYDEVILAAPFQFADLDIDLASHDRPKEIPYVKLHVTLFTTPHELASTAFGLNADVPPPRVILTTLNPSDSPGHNESSVGSAGFFSISTLRAVTNPKTGGQEYLYKIFSPEPIGCDFFADIFGLSSDAINTSPSAQNITWIYRKVWNSYPHEFPRKEFETLRIEPHLWYTAGIESFISTMETSALMGANVAKLVVDCMSNSKETLGDDEVDAVHLEM